RRHLESSVVLVWVSSEGEPCCVRMNPAGVVEYGEFVGIVSRPRLHQSFYEATFAARAWSRNHDSQAMPTDNASVYKQATGCVKSDIKPHGQFHAVENLMKDE